MKRKLKLYVCMLLAVALVLACGTTAFAADVSVKTSELLSLNEDVTPVTSISPSEAPTDVTPGINCIVGSMVAQATEGKSLTASTLELPASGSDLYLDEDISTARIDPDRQVSKTFRHTLYYSNGNVLATVYVTVTGVCSQANNYAYVTNISASASGSGASGLSYTTSTGGSTGSISLYYNNAYIGSFSYQVNKNGSIVNIG